MDGCWSNVLGTVSRLYGRRFFADGGMILDNPWGIVSLVDLYVGFAIFSMWIFFREKNIYISIPWMVEIMVLGWLAGSLYVALNLGRNKGDWKRFFMGWRSEEV